MGSDATGVVGWRKVEGGAVQVWHTVKREGRSEGGDAGSAMASDGEAVIGTGEAGGRFHISQFLTFAISRFSDSGLLCPSIVADRGGAMLRPVRSVRSISLFLCHHPSVNLP